MVANPAGDLETPYILEQDPTRPTYPEVTLCRFSPKQGHLAAIASKHGLFVYDVENKTELMLLV
jgi:WD40 repeat protein